MVSVLSKLVRLSYWSRIHGVTPEAFQVLLPPHPEVQKLPGPPEEAAQEGDAANGTVVDERDPETRRAYELLQMVSYSSHCMSSLRQY